MYPQFFNFNHNCGLEKVTLIRLKSWIKAFPFPFDCDPGGKSPVVI